MKAARACAAVMLDGQVGLSPPRPYQGLPEFAYPMHDRDIMVTPCGRPCMHR